jgi:hypothetical protein
MRAFACAVLLRAAAEPENEEELFTQSQDSTLAQCLSSGKVLGPEVLEALAQFLTWRIPRMAYSCHDALVFPLGLLVVAINLHGGRLEEQVLVQTAECFLADVAALRPACRPFASRDSAGPFGDLFSVQQGHWKPHVDDLIRQGDASSSADVKKMLQFAAGLLGHS